MAVEVQLKKWGNSVGVVLPREIVEQKKLKESDKIVIEIVKIVIPPKIEISIRENPNIVIL